MKKHFFYLALSLFSSILVSCSNDSENNIDTLASMDNTKTVSLLNDAEPYISPYIAINSFSVLYILNGTI